MDLSQLEYFQAVAEYENITRASRKLYVSQPTLSQSIARLEESLEVELFDRRNGKLYLNDAGRIFLARVDNAFSELNAGFAELKIHQKRQQDWVYVTSSVTGFFIDVILDYHKSKPHVHIDHTLSANRDIAERIVNSKVDFAITTHPINELRVNCLSLGEEEVFAVVGKNHPLFGHKSATLEELRQYPLVCNNCYSDLTFMEELFQTDYRELNIAAASNENHIISTLTVEGYCIGFIPARLAVNHLKDTGLGLWALRLSPVVRRSICLCTLNNRQLSPSAEELYRHVLERYVRSASEVEAYIQSYYCI